MQRIVMKLLSFITIRCIVQAGNVCANTRCLGYRGRNRETLIPKQTDTNKLVLLQILEYKMKLAIR